MSYNYVILKTSLTNFLEAKESDLDPIKLTICEVKKIIETVVGKVKWSEEEVNPKFGSGRCDDMMFELWLHHGEDFFSLSVSNLKHDRMKSLGILLGCKVFDQDGVILE